MIVADPRVTKTAMMADLFLPLKPRSDIALLNGLIHLLIRRGKLIASTSRSTRQRIRGARTVRRGIYAYVRRTDYRA